MTNSTEKLDAVGRDLDVGKMITLGPPLDSWSLARMARSVAGVVERRGWDVETARELLAMLGVLDDRASVKLTRDGLRSSRLARTGIAHQSARHSTHRSFKLSSIRERPMPVLAPAVEPAVEPVAVSVAVSEPVVTPVAVPLPEGPVRLCRRGLHALVGHNAVSRPDRPGRFQCRACANAARRRRRAGIKEAPTRRWCRRGLHELAGENVVTRRDRPGSVQCRACTIDRQRRDRELVARLKADYRAASEGS